MTEKLSPFDFINSISHNKKDIINESDNPEETAKMYVPFVVNRGLSYHADTVLHANEMNMCHRLPPEAQYQYYLNILRPKKRFSKWFKPEPNQKLELVKEYFQVNDMVAKQYLKILSDEQITTIIQKMQEGGINNGR